MATALKRLPLVAQPTFAFIGVMKQMYVHSSI